MSPRGLISPSPKIYKNLFDQIKEFPTGTTIQHQNARNMGSIILAILTEKVEYPSQEQPLNYRVVIPVNLDDSPSITRLSYAFQYLPYSLASVAHNHQHNNVLGGTI